MSLFDMYDFLKPPLELVEHLEKYEAKGQPPAPVVDYLNKWRAIRGEQPFALDGMVIEWPVENIGWTPIK